MKKRQYFLFSWIFLFLIAGAFASCEEGQININSADISELTKIIYIGEVKASRLIESRPFDSVDNLVKVNGIAETILGKIKTQGLACVGKEKSEDTPKKNKEGEPSKISQDSELEDKKNEKKNPESSKIDEVSLFLKEKNVKKENPPRKIELIKLESQTIKSQENTKSLKKTNSETYYMYGFVVFCVLIGTLFILKRNNYKNEFE